jgi:hypothetical protein
MFHYKPPPTILSSNAKFETKTYYKTGNDTNRNVGGFQTLIWPICVCDPGSPQHHTNFRFLLQSLCYKPSWLLIVWLLKTGIFLRKWRQISSKIYWFQTKQKKLTVTNFVLLYTLLVRLFLIQNKTEECFSDNFVFSTWITYKIIIIIILISGSTVLVRTLAASHLFWHLVGLLWTSDQPVTKASTYTGQHNIETKRQTSRP